jgi:hypothetical protein
LRWLLDFWKICAPRYWSNFVRYTIPLWLIVWCWGMKCVFIWD